MSKVLSLVVLMLIAVAAVVLWVELNQPIRTVRVSGELSAAEQQEIRSAMAASLEEGLLGVDLASVREDIHDLSWPRAVTVRRLWPAGLEIEVEKDLAVASWGDAGYLTSDGRVMQFPDSPVGLPGFLCDRSQPPAAMEIYGLLNETLAGSGVKISILRESELGEWEVELASGIRVVLGRHELVDRMRRFRLALEHSLHDRLEMVRYVDARYANGIAVRWKETLIAYEEEIRYGI
ncbi:MAG: FtsQ-type POTRA domain-containing protein [Gammaproteobacteria bacterium]|nr:FtsQ-type POTRA domain-containing protein [Gammaproteobacteria bacterium]